MGGKVWSDGEEEVFWSVVAKSAPPGFHKESKAVKKGRRNISKSWMPLRDVMKKHMRNKHPGEDLPREYSTISIYEHWFQNLVQGKLSPNAARHVQAHRAWLKTAAENPESAFEVGQAGSSTSVESGSSESTASSTRPGSEKHTTPGAVPQAARPQQMQLSQELQEKREQLRQIQQLQQSQQHWQHQQSQQIQYHQYQPIQPIQQSQQMPPWDTDPSSFLFH